ncbi:LysR family transcriptional regulator [Xenorhabdus nematophila]|uniref:Transcriptional regulator (LysR family) n=1 Tax=Xenorhabdus nematophila (strain ATCC 19061 / DSM 3370 / CCUG 14189 / LMG 1036 / NCIMB 9965 / AN6) TaxID=406817 RepID=D3VI26_XENNA|nr:LysR family transcriptional regulator [Xenorhabdus nematophila]CEF31590.1 putative transcriptional regulator (LysR family) [Xenorhabdus nematophila str. Websteri]AYA41362.1 LysR family transcriptional regulator [Xenorhabdus nematophila]KHD29782.1 LysR family transcriptional regulator [Xenorhabdus nematophila]MBA0020099.1 LysR family transcriptional regulator [Xenorhabdus nematophila]MCB4423787.1 LysR family transcriptional regulator [Xenorhabdus nematophila]
MNHDLTLWHLFFRIVERGSLIKAAKDLHLDPSVASRRLAALEHQLKAQLINRSTRKLSLTAAGTVAYEQMRPLLDEIDGVLSDINNKSLVGKIKITAPVNFGEHYVTQWLTLFQLQNPDITFDLVLSDQCLDLRQEGIDLAIRIGELPASTLIAKKLGNMSGVLCASPEYLLKHGTPKHPQDLNYHKSVIYSLRQNTSPTRLQLSRDRVVEHVELSGSFYLNNVGAIYQAVCHGVGIHAGPAWLFNEAILNKKLVRLLPDWQLPTLPIHLLRMKNHYVPSQISALIDWIVLCWKESEKLE